MPRDDEAAFEQTLQALALPSDRPIALDATISAAGRLDTTFSKGRGTPIPLEASLRRLTLGLPDSDRESVAPPMENAEIEVVSLLGKGGMGAVYLAVERVLNRQVAIKTTFVDSNPDSVASLCAEGVITGSLEHPGIVPVHQLAKASDGRPVLVMKRIEGANWSALLDDDQHPMWRRIALQTEGDADARRAFHLEVLSRVCEALAFAHSRGVVHRDIKPENVMVGEYGEVYLVDWGLAIRTHDRTEKHGLVGTPRYMAPEMVSGRPVDARTDVYLLGATLHEILTGSPPHRGDTLHRVLFAALQSEPKEYGREVPIDLAALATRAMSQEPEKRFESAREFRDALAAHAKNRVSQRLSRRAREILNGELEPLLHGQANDVSPAYRALAECRFALREARREWPDNPAIDELELGCIAAAARIEIRRRDPAAARAIIAECDSPPSELRVAIETLEGELERERDEAERLRKLAELGESNAQARTRVATGVLGVMGAIFVSVYSSMVETRAGITVFDLMTFPMITSAFGVVAVGISGRELLTHPFNRRAVMWLFGCLGAIILNRFLALLIGTSVPHTLVHDLGILTVCFALGALWLFRLLMLAAIMLFGTGVYIALHPEEANRVFNIATTLSLIIAVFAARQRRTIAPTPGSTHPAETTNAPQ